MKQSVGGGQKTELWNSCPTTSNISAELANGGPQPRFGIQTCFVLSATLKKNNNNLNQSFKIRGFSLKVKVSEKVQRTVKA